MAHSPDQDGFLHVVRDAKEFQVLRERPQEAGVVFFWLHTKPELPASPEFLDTHQTAEGFSPQRASAEDYTLWKPGKGMCEFDREGSGAVPEQRLQLWQ